MRGERRYFQFAQKGKHFENERYSLMKPGQWYLHKAEGVWKHLQRATSNHIMNQCPK